MTQRFCLTKTMLIPLKPDTCLCNFNCSVRQNWYVPIEHKDLVYRAYHPKMTSCPSVSIWSFTITTIHKLCPGIHEWVHEACLNSNQPQCHSRWIGLKPFWNAPRELAFQNKCSLCMICMHASNLRSLNCTKNKHLIFTVYLLTIISSIDY